MYARVSTLSVPPERMKEARREIRDRALRSAKALPGRTRTFWLSDEAAGIVVAVSLYDTEANLLRNREVASSIREGSAESVGGKVESVQEFKVIAEV